MTYSTRLTPDGTLQAVHVDCDGTPILSASFARAEDARRFAAEAIARHYLVARGLTAEQSAAEAPALAADIGLDPTARELDNRAAPILRRLEDESCFVGNAGPDMGPPVDARPIASARRLPLPGPRARKFGDHSRLGRGR